MIETRLTIDSNEAISTRREVRAASQRWIENFNSGNLEQIVQAYGEKAVMRAKPHGRFTGRKEIQGFWESLLEEGFAELEYRDVKIDVQSNDEAVLSANWNMNLASGVITKELWRHQEDGIWRLEEDDFAVNEQTESTTGPSHSVGSTALLIIDMQNDYFPGGAMGLCETHTAAGHANRLLSTFRKLKLPRFHVRHIFTSKDAPFFRPGSVGASIHSSVEPADGEPIIVKNHINSFRNTELHEELQAAGVEQLVICGAMSHMCIDGTVRAAADSGYRCLVAQDACATRDASFEGRTIRAADVHAAVMSALAFAYADVISTDEAVARMVHETPLSNSDS
ncbi:MAG: isochorismatase family protein [Phycisphaerales bacterium]|nr:isochorismatase family protein [Phycisphaerales bacterium]